MSDETERFHQINGEIAQVSHEILDPVIEARAREADANTAAFFQCLDLLEQIVGKLYELRRKQIHDLEVIPDDIWSAPPPYDFAALLQEVRRARDLEVPPLTERIGCSDGR